MIDAIDEFGRKARGADVAFVYYSGHGMQVSGTNYLIPVDADIKDGAHIRRDSVAVAEILERLEEAAPRLAVLVLDACRDNPFAARTKSVTKGLARMNVSGGNLLVAYATQEGSTAVDGTRGNSPYAVALADSLKKKNLRVLEQFDPVAFQVRRATSNGRRPTRYGDVPVGTFLLPEAARSTAGSSGAAAFDPETESWEAAKRANTLAGYEAFREKYPSGRYKDSVEIAISAFGRASAGGQSAQPRRSEAPATSAAKGSQQGPIAPAPPATAPGSGSSEPPAENAVAVRRVLELAFGSTFKNNVMLHAVFYPNATSKPVVSTDPKSGTTTILFRALAMKRGTS